ncbi:Alpha/Beta hydrolase protein [Zopfochytrium polystomum]|nr:Alpha/Beta hydrolase protein [Zopfochytrium polystomum]
MPNSVNGGGVVGGSGGIGQAQPLPPHRHYSESGNISSTSSSNGSGGWRDRRSPAVLPDVAVDVTQVVRAAARPENAFLPPPPEPTAFFLQILAAAVPLTLVVLIFLWPVILAIVVALYAVAILVYLRMAQTANPLVTRWYAPQLPWHPLRVVKINMALLDLIVNGFLLSPATGIAARWIWRTLWEKRRSRKGAMLCPDIPFSPHDATLTLDVYCKAAAVAARRASATAPTTAATRKRRPPLPPPLLRPVLVFEFGGGWSSGDKKLYGPLANTLVQAGYVVVVPNYRLFARGGRIADMVEAVRSAVVWTFDNIQGYGGDPLRIHLMGHSAGAHLCALTVIHDVASRLRLQATARPPSPFTLPPFEDRLPPIQGLILLAGVYDINKHFEFEAGRGVEEVSAMARVMGSTAQSFNAASPAVLLRAFDRTLVESGRLRHLLPKHWLLVHGDIDATVPARESVELHRILRHEVRVEDVVLEVYPRVEHSRPVVELMLPNSDYTLTFLVALRNHVLAAGRDTLIPVSPTSSSSLAASLLPKPLQQQQPFQPHTPHPTGKPLKGILHIGSTASVGSGGEVRRRSASSSTGGGDAGEGEGGDAQMRGRTAGRATTASPTPMADSAGPPPAGLTKRRPSYAQLMNASAGAMR